FAGGAHQSESLPGAEHVVPVDRIVDQGDTVARAPDVAPAQRRHLLPVGPAGGGTVGDLEPGLALVQIGGEGHLQVGHAVLGTGGLLPVHPSHEVHPGQVAVEDDVLGDRGGTDRVVYTQHDPH